MTLAEKAMRTLIFIVLLVAGLAQGPAQAAQPAAIENVNNGGQKSLRGLNELDATVAADAFKQIPRCCRTCRRDATSACNATFRSPPPSR